MTDITEKTENGELVTNRDQLVVVDNIESLIKVIRGQQVMLDKDLATLYGVETRTLNQAVKRNIQRFPSDFRFQLTMEECSKSQIVTLNAGRGQNIKKLPYAFTEQGVAMLSSVLRSQTAIEVNIQIMRAFVSMRHFMVNNASVFSRLETIEYHQLEMQQHQQETDKRIDEVFRRLDEGNAKPKQGVFYNGQVYDAYTFVSDLIKSAKKRIVLIDNYVDETVLTLLDKRDNNVSAIIYTQQISRQFHRVARLADKWCMPIHTTQTLVKKSQLANVKDVMGDSSSTRSSSSGNGSGSLGSGSYSCSSQDFNK